MFKNRKRKGFTLIELVIVIAIIGILIAIAIPRFSSATEGANNRKIEANARSIAGAIAQYYAKNSKYPATNTKEVLTDAGINVDTTIAANAAVAADGTKSEGYTFTVDSATSQITVVYSWADGAGTTAYTGQDVPGKVVKDTASTKVTFTF